MIYQPDGEFPGFGWIEELLQAQPQEKDVGPRLLDPAQCALDRKDAGAARFTSRTKSVVVATQLLGILGAEG